MKKNAEKLAEEALNKVMGVFAQAKTQVESIVSASGLKERTKATNEKILHGLKSMGIATRDEVEALEARISELESKIDSHKH